MKRPWEKKVFIIAEAGVNHNGRLDLAKKLIDVAKTSGADAIKFQTWKNEEITSRFVPKVDYIRHATSARESLWDLLERLALPYEAFRELQAYARKRGILFLSTPDGFESLDFLADELKLPYIKVGSTEVTHLCYLEAIARKRRPIILSTGLSNMSEVKKAVGTIRRHYKGPLILLHCTSAYPAPLSEINLRAMVSMRKVLRLPVGFSDHSRGKEAAIAAVALGAVIIEKHFTLDNALEGPDHQASLNPAELAEFVAAVRATEQLLGDGIKRMSLSEKRNVAGIRRSIVARRSLTPGTILTEDLLTCKRPGTGLSPELLDTLIGRKIKKTVEQDEPLQWAHLR